MKKDWKKNYELRALIIVELIMCVVAITITIAVTLYAKSEWINAQKDYVERIVNSSLQNVKTPNDLRQAKQYIQSIEKNWDIEWFVKKAYGENYYVESYIEDNHGIMVKELEGYSVIIKYDIETINSKTRKFTVWIFLITVVICKIIGVILMNTLKRFVIEPMLERIKHIQARSEKDGMTQLYNKCRYISRICYYNSCSSVGVIYIDVNDLKITNDLYGHDAGNELLCSVANAMKSLSYPNLECYRFGGDEFVIILPDCNETQIEKVKVDFLKMIEKITLKSSSMQVTVACGVSFQDKSIDIEKLIKQADYEMYRRKRKQKQNN